MPRVNVKVQEVPAPSEKTAEIFISFADGVESCVGSNIRWENEDLMEGLRTMFHARGDEIINSITINKFGIKATFANRK